MPSFKEYIAGVHRQQYKYKDFFPSHINQEWSWEDPRINVLLESATKALGELNAYALIVPDVDLFIHMHIAKEANTSSRIEGTKTEMDEVILGEMEILPERRDDWREVQNYIEAMNTSIEQLENLPLSLRLLKQTHEILMSGVRGRQKTPGEFRRSQNWIGGSTLADAAFIPPHHEDLPDLLGDLEAFWHNENIQVPHLIRIALSHYQFEAIHPFLDGNGRIGRLLITLYLVSHRLLEKPSLYLSAHFEKHRDAYYDALSRVRATNDLGHWCRFFLQAVVETAESGKNTFRRILALRQELESDMAKLGRRAENGRRLIVDLFKDPVVTVPDVVSKFGLKETAARNLINALVELDVLREITGYRRNRIFVFQRYMDIFEEKVPSV